MLSDEATYYRATANAAPRRPALAGDATADVCVIGGGYTGLSAALHLAERGYRVVLLESGRIGSGASGRNGGQLHFGQRKDQEDLEAQLGDAQARRLWDLAEDAKALVRALIARHAIDCGLRDGLIHAAWKARDTAPLEHSVAHMAQRYGYAQTWIPKSEMGRWVQSERYHGAVFDPGGGHLHALNYALGLAQAAEAAGALLHEDSCATTLDGTTVRTSSGSVTAAHVVLACDTWLAGLEPRAGAYALPINSFVAVTEPLGEERAKALIPNGAAVADTKFVVDYYRVTPDHRLLFGGGETYTPRYPADLKQFVAKPMLRVFPQLADAKLDYAWGGPVGVTLSRLPHFGRCATNTLFAHGFSGQGVALATLAGQLLAETVAGQAERFDVFASLKHRPFPGGRLLRTPIMALGMAWYALKDRL